MNGVVVLSIVENIVFEVFEIHIQDEDQEKDDGGEQDSTDSDAYFAEFLLRAGAAAER